MLFNGDAGGAAEAPCDTGQENEEGKAHGTIVSRLSRYYVGVNRPILSAALTAVWLVSMACSTATKPAPKEPEKPDEPITGRTAFQRVFAQARAWAPDSTILKIQNANLTEVKSKDGKAGAWQVTFVSASRQQARTFTWSALEGEGFHKGVFAQAPESYSGPRGQNSPFVVHALKTDTDEALETAVKKSAAYLKKN